MFKLEFLFKKYGDMMKDASLSKEDYFSSQIEQAIIEKEAEEIKVQSLRVQAQEYYPLVERAADISQEKFQKIVKNLIDENYKEVYEKQFRSALSLKPFIPGFANWLVWAFLVGLGFFLQHSIFLQVIVIGGIYTFLFKKSRKAAAVKICKPFKEEYENFSKYKITFMHFCEKESGNPEYPYAAIRAPNKERPVSIEWRLEKNNGAFFNERFVVVQLDQDENKEFALIHMPKDGRECKILPISAKTSDKSWTVKEGILKNLGEVLKEEVESIEKFAVYGEECVLVEQRIKLHKQRIKTLKNVQLNWKDVSITD